MSLPKPHLHPTSPKGFRMNLRKSIVTVTVSAAAVLSLAACQSEAPQVSTTTDVTTTAPAPAPAAEPAKNTVDDNSDVVFLKVIGQHGLPQTQESIDAAKSMCRALDRGADPEQVALIAYQGFDGDIDKAGALLGAGAAAYCPEHVDALTSIGSAGA